MVCFSVVPYTICNWCHFGNKLNIKVFEIQKGPKIKKIINDRSLAGALAQPGKLPLGRDVFESVLRARMPVNKVAVNLNAFDIGKQLIKT
jgi:hypothetical protein